MRRVNRFRYAGNWTRIRLCVRSLRLDYRVLPPPERDGACRPRRPPCFRTRSTWEPATLSGSCSARDETGRNTALERIGKAKELHSAHREIRGKGVLFYENEPVFRVRLAGTMHATYFLKIRFTNSRVFNKYTTSSIVRVKIALLKRVRKNV